MDNFLLDLASFTKRQEIELNLLPKIENKINFQNKNYKPNFEIKFSEGISNTFKIGSLLFQLQIKNNIVKLFTSKNNIFHGELFDRQCTEYVADLFFIVASQKLVKKWEYQIGSYSVKRFSPKQLKKYIDNNISSFYKVILDNPDEFPNGVVKSKFDNSLIVNTNNGGFIKFYEITENKPIILLDPIKNSKDKIINYLSNKLQELVRYTEKLKNSDLCILRENTQLKIQNHYDLSKNKIHQIKNTLFNLEIEKLRLDKQLKDLKEYYKRLEITRLNLFTESYSLENNLLIHLLPYDPEYHKRLSVVKSELRIEKINAIRELKNNSTYTMANRNYNDNVKKINLDHQQYIKNCLSEIRQFQMKIAKYEKRINDLICIDIDKILNTIERKVCGNDQILTVNLKNNQSVKYRNDQGTIKKLTNNQIKRSVTKVINDLYNGSSKRKLRLIGSLVDMDKIISIAKINQDTDYFPTILSSKLSDQEYKNINNQWLHDLDLTLIDF